MSKTSVKFGKTVRRIRLRKNLSQGGLGRILKVHPTYISGIERGVRNMSLKNIVKLANALKVLPSELLK